MPIYGNGLIGAPYVLDKEIKYSDLTKLMKVFNSCLYAFRSSHPEFVHSIDLNFKMEYNFVAKYNFGRCGLDEYKYMQLMKELIDNCNDAINKKSGGAFKNRKFDITGTWVAGAVIIMIKNKNSIIN